MNHLPSLDNLFQFDPDLNDELFCDRIRLKSQQCFSRLLQGRQCANFNPPPLLFKIKKGLLSETHLF